MLSCAECGGACPAPELVPTVWEIRDGIGGPRRLFHGVTCAPCRASLLDEFHFSSGDVVRVGFAGLDRFRREMVLAAQYAHLAGFPPVREG